MQQTLFGLAGGIAFFLYTSLELHKLLRLILPALRPLLTPGADLICLVKPQFEAGREKVGKKGVVREAETHREVILQAAGYATDNILGSYLHLHFAGFPKAAERFVEKCAGYAEKK